MKEGHAMTRQKKEIINGDDDGRQVDESGGRTAV